MRNQQRIAVLSENEEFKQNFEISTKVLEIVNNYTHSTKQIAKVLGSAAS
ncbi:hypothetical protein ACEQPO_11185 [Bacillus sp. SL00103]